MKCTSVFVLVLVGLVTAQVRADGKFFWVREEVPPDIPYQRAFLLFDEGSETLVVQSKYALGTPTLVEALGWIVPVPNIPELNAGHAGATSLFFSNASRLARPHARRVSTFLRFVPPVIFLAGVVLLLLCLVQYPLVRMKRLSRANWERRGSIGCTMTLLGFLLVLFTMPSLGRAGLSGGVEVVKAEQVGIYDVKVIRGDKAEPVMEWLKENEFAFGEEDTAAFGDYVARDWCFVTPDRWTHIG